MRKNFYAKMYGKASSVVPWRNDMLKDIIKKEILDNLLSSKFVLTFIISTALILLSVYMGISCYLLDKKEYEASVAAVNEDFQALERAETNFSPGALRICRRPQALKTIVNGVSDAAGRMSKPGNIQESYLDESKYGSNPDLTVFGALDLEFIVRMVLSLFALLFTYDSVSGEKEKGTLKMALAKNLSRISPASGLTLCGMVLTRTGAEEYNRFLDATRDYRAVYNDWLVKNNLRNALGQVGPNTVLGVADMPQFRFEPESLGESLMRTLPDFALMAAMTVVFLTGAFFAFIRYDVR